MKIRIRDYDRALNEIDAKIRYVNYPECWMQLWLRLRAERDRLIQDMQNEKKVIHMKNFSSRLA
jgi:hypothetical protein